MIPTELTKIKRAVVPTTGLPSDNNHDPSNIIFFEGKYYLWFTQHMNDRPYDHFADTKIMCCTSSDGYAWSQPFDALLPSESEAWDDSGVLTAYVIRHNGKFYLFYTGVDKRFASGETSYRTCGVAVADSPDGMFKRFRSKPILLPGAAGSWEDEANDDITILYWKEKWHAFFKGTTYACTNPDMTQLGVATSNNFEGPYEKYQGNPIIKGHAFAVWPYGDGLLMLTGLKHTEGTIYGGDWHDKIGIQYLYYSSDGINFEPCCEFPNRAAGIYYPDNDGTHRYDICDCWGVSVNTTDTDKKRFIERFDFEKN